jgi:hypothetical protein
MKLERVEGYRDAEGIIHATEKRAIQANVMYRLCLDFGFSANGGALSSVLSQRDVDAMQFVLANRDRLASHFKDYPL